MLRNHKKHAFYFRCGLITIIIVNNKAEIHYEL